MKDKKQYYIFKDNKSYGPYNESQIFKMLLNNEINKETLIWNIKSKSSTFKKLIDTFDLNNNIQQNITQKEENVKLSNDISNSNKEEIKNSDLKIEPIIKETFEINTFHPWKRYIANVIDCGIAAGISCLFYQIYTLLTNKNFLVSIIEQNFGFRLSIFMLGILYSSLFIGLLGTTPGKFLFGIKIIDNNNQKPIGFLKGLKRCILCVFFATWLLPTLLAILIPYSFNCTYIIFSFLLFQILPLVPLLISYFYYKKNGKTKWDVILNTNVIYIKKKRNILVRVIIKCLIVFTVVLILLGLLAIFDGIAFTLHLCKN